MSEVKVPFVVDNKYATISLKCGSLSEETLLTVLRSEVDIDKLSQDMKRHNEIKMTEDCPVCRGKDLGVFEKTEELCEEHTEMWSKMEYYSSR